MKKYLLVQTRSSLSASVTPTTATLSWTENGTATTYNLDVVLSGAGQSATPSDPGVSNNFLKENLTPETDYQYYVQADCGFTGESSWVGPYNFSTPCASNTAPYFEGFETGYTDATTVGGCIVQESITGSGVILDSKLFCNKLQPFSKNRKF